MASGNQTRNEMKYEEWLSSCNCPNTVAIIVHLPPFFFTYLIFWSIKVSFGNPFTDFCFLQWWGRYCINVAEILSDNWQDWSWTLSRVSEVNYWRPWEQVKNTNTRSLFILSAFVAQNSEGSLVWFVLVLVWVLNQQIFCQTLFFSCIYMKRWNTVSLWYGVTFSKISVASRIFTLQMGGLRNKKLNNLSKLRGCLALKNICFVIWKHVWKYMWVKNCVKIRVILFENWKHVFEIMYQTAFILVISFLLDMPDGCVWFHWAYSIRQACKRIFSWTRVWLRGMCGLCYTCYVGSNKRVLIVNNLVTH